MKTLEDIQEFLNEWTWAKADSFIDLCEIPVLSTRPNPLPHIPVWSWDDSRVLVWDTFQFVIKEA